MQKNGQYWLSRPSDQTQEPSLSMTTEKMQRDFHNLAEWKANDKVQILKISSD